MKITSFFSTSYFGKFNIWNWLTLEKIWQSIFRIPSYLSMGNVIYIESRGNFHISFEKVRGQDCT